jgi:two-component system, OmpR family, response regulator
VETKIRVLVVEDNHDLRESVVECLTLAGLAAVGVGNAAECYQALVSGDFNVALVDIGLPDQSGYVLANYIRANTALAVIILTARDALDDRVRGYDSGADLYLVKPVDGRELAAAVTSLAQRQKLRAEPQPAALPAHDAWSLHLGSWKLAAPNGTSSELTAKEMQFLELLATTPGRAVMRDTLLNKLYLRHDEYTSRSLDSLVRRLRAKVTADTGVPVPIKTAHAVGYCFSATLHTV